MIMSDTVIIIDAYLNNQYKIDIFTKTFNAVKKLNLPIILVSNSKVPDEFSSKVDHCLFINRNLLFTDSYPSYPQVCFFMGSDILRYEHVINLTQKHGLSVMSNLKIASKYAEQLGYKKFIRVEWDFQIHDDDLPTIKNLIDDFSINDKRAYFIYNPLNASRLPDICYHFWMVDLKFWNDNFPTINSESDYKDLLISINEGKFFETAERILYITFFSKLNTNEYISEIEFRKIYEKSVINFFLNDINFVLPSDSGVCSGLCRINRKGHLTNEIALFTWNRNNLEKIERSYEILIKGVPMKFVHELDFGMWQVNWFDSVSNEDFPIKMNVLNKCDVVYNSIDDLNYSIIILPS